MASIYGREKYLTYVTTWSRTDAGWDAYCNFRREMEERGFRRVLETPALVRYYEPRTTQASLWTYNGRYGRGFALTWPNLLSSNYSYINYYTLSEGENDDE